MAELTDFEKVKKVFSEIGGSFAAETYHPEWDIICLISEETEKWLDLYFNKETGKYESCD